MIFFLSTRVPDTSQIKRTHLWILVIAKVKKSCYFHILILKLICKSTFYTAQFLLQNKENQNDTTWWTCSLGMSNSNQPLVGQMKHGLRCSEFVQYFNYYCDSNKEVSHCIATFCLLHQQTET